MLIIKNLNFTSVMYLTANNSIKMDERYCLGIPLFAYQLGIELTFPIISSAVSLSTNNEELKL
jgi:hypothetical protein